VPPVCFGPPIVWHAPSDITRAETMSNFVT
jgi:hypothetical protein